MRRAFEGDSGYVILVLLTISVYSVDEALTIKLAVFELDILAHLIYEDMMILLNIEQGLTAYTFIFEYATDSAIDGNTEGDIVASFHDYI